MSNIYICDAHCDTVNAAYYQNPQTTVSISDPTKHVDLSRLKKAGVKFQVFAIWNKPQYGNYLLNTLKMINPFTKFVHENAEDINLVTNTAELHQDLNNNKIGAILAIEGGEALNGSVDVLEILHKLGVRLITLTWNHRNEIADGCGEAQSKSGLTKFGREVISKMNNLHMIIDVSHLSESAFWEVIELSQSPIIASHSNCRSLCDHVRNLSDDQIKAIISKSGFMGITFYPPFLNNTDQANIDDIVAHIKHILDLGGENIVGFGSDFDGATTADGINGVQDMPEIVQMLLASGISEEIVHKICHGNFIRVMSEILE